MLGKTNTNKLYWLPIAKLTLCAVTVTFGSMLMFPESYIFFGVLHCILLARLICKPLLKQIFFTAGLGSGLILFLGILIVSLGIFHHSNFF